MLKEIGSNFWLDPNQRYVNQCLGTPEQFNCKGNDYVWVSSGRTAISFVIQTIEKRNPRLKKVALLPSFTCDTVFDPFLKAGYKVYYYSINEDLETSPDCLLEEVYKCDASIVLFHRYFGFDTIGSKIDILCETLRHLGKYSIEDCTQCLYSHIHRADSDFTIGSIRKWTGTPDGGFAVCREGLFNGKPRFSDIELEKAKLKASYAKYMYLIKGEGDKSVMLELYKKAEHILDSQNALFAISEMSSVVQANLNREELVLRRRRNYNYLYKSLPDEVKPVFSFDCLLEVPLYLPILVKCRSNLQKHLANHSIYAPVVWPKDERQPKQCECAERAYQQLLCIPIDQRYDLEDMHRISIVINDYYKAPRV